MKSWSVEDKEEYHEATHSAYTLGENSHQRIDVWVDNVQAALASGRMWARDLEAEAWRVLAAKRLRDHSKAQRSNIAITYDGRVLSKARVAGVKTVTSDGRVAVAQTLFDFMSWEQLQEKATEYVKQIDAYKANLLVVIRLLELASAAPGATNPGEALQMLDLSMQEWIDSRDDGRSDRKAS